MTAARQVWKDGEAARRAVLAAGPPLVDVDAAADCRCSCHPRPAQLDLHGGGPGCGCQLSDVERRARAAAAVAALRAASDRFDAVTFRGRIVAAAEQAGATVTHFLPAAPFVLAGLVDGYGFYLRERHGWWQLVVAGDDCPDLDVWQHQPDAAVVLAEGSTSRWDGGDVADAVADAVAAVRTHAARRRCPHPNARAWCPDCGTRMC